MRMPGVPSKLNEILAAIGDNFSFSRKEIKVWVIITSAAAAAAVMITVAVPGLSGKERKGPETAEAGYSITDKIQESSSDKIFTSDFMLYEDSIEETFTGIIYSREPLERWSEEFAEKYLIDPEAIIAELLGKESEKVIKDIFADVP
jgi:hypothetical protein